MTHRRRRLAFLIAGWCCAHVSIGQEAESDSAPAPPPSSPPATPTGTPSGATTGATAPVLGGSTPPSSSSGTSTGPNPYFESGTPGASSSFGSGSSGTSSGSGSIFDIFKPGGGASDSSTEGSSPFGLQPKPSADAPPSFTLPGFYGQGSTTLFGGVGRLGRSRYETTAGVFFGYDDNIFQTPRDNTPQIIPGISAETGRPEERVIQEADPGGQPIYELRPVFSTGGTVVYRPVRVGFTEPKPRITEPVLLNLPAGKPTGSFFTRANFGFQMTQFSRRSLLTLDLSGGETYYFNRQDDPAEFNGSASATWLYRFSPRLQVTAQFNSAYLSQPDLSRANTPERQIRGDIINTLGRLDVAYRFTPRFSMTLTANYAGNRYTEAAEQVNDYDNYTIGLQATYLWKARWTLLTEFRHSLIQYAQNAPLDATTDYFLVGTEFALNPRLTGSLRIGAAIKQFDMGGEQTSPYAETTTVYRSTARSTVSWVNRFGFEEPFSPGDQRLVYRSSIQYAYAFTPRLAGSASVNLIHELTTNDDTDTDIAQDTFDATLGLGYQMTKDLSFNASYSFTLVNSNVDFASYYRSRVTIGASYAF